MLPKQWDEVLPRLARAAHNSQMADDWEDLPADGIERAIWIQTVAAVCREIQAILDEPPA